MKKNLKFSPRMSSLYNHLKYTVCCLPHLLCYASIPSCDNLVRVLLLWENRIFKQDSMQEARRHLITHAIQRLLAWRNATISPSNVVILHLATCCTLCLVIPQPAVMFCFESCLWKYRHSKTFVTLSMTNRLYANEKEILETYELWIKKNESVANIKSHIICFHKRKSVNKI